MIVCSLPRCGATRFCLDIQNSSGKQFVGELNPLYMFENRKALHHETKSQQTFTQDQFAALIHNSDDYIIMVNKSPYLIADKADYIMLRKNMQDAFLSYANFILKLYPDIVTKVLIKEVQDSIYDYYGLKSYIERYPCDIVWYEDYYNKTGTSTPLLDKHIHGKVIKRAILNAFKDD